MALPIRCAFAQAPYAQLLGSTSTRCASTFAAAPPSRGKSQDGRNASEYTQRRAKPAAKRTIARMVPSDVAKFFRNGVLTTTPDNAAFFRENPTIDPDHGKMSPIDDTDAIRRLAAEYKVRLGWSPLHIIGPWRLRFFDPQGHPRAPKIRSDYVRMARNKKLWTFSTSIITKDRAVVWQLTKCLLTRAVHRSLAALGYDDAGRTADGKMLHGTLWLHVWEPQHAHRLTVDRFGELVADTLDKHYSTRPQEREARRGRRTKVEAKEKDYRLETDAEKKTQWQPRERSSQMDRRERHSAVDEPFAVLKSKRVSATVDGPTNSSMRNSTQWKPRERRNDMESRGQYTREHTTKLDADAQTTWRPRKRN